MKILLIFFAVLSLSSCSFVIPEHQLIQLNNIDKESSLFEINQYNKKVIQKTNILSNITFRFKGRTMKALGITKIDENNKAYKVAALSPMGITIFQLEVKDSKIVSSYIIPKLSPDSDKVIDKNEADKAAEMISKDIAHIYFNRIINIEKDSLKFNKYKVTINTEIENNAFLKYIFTGKPLRLTTKIKYENKKKIWSVDYYNYQNTDLKEMPFNIIFQNHKYGYLLEIETKKTGGY
jgi:outer membrane biogenesis lipoprotein LolB